LSTHEAVAAEGSYTLRVNGASRAVSVPPATPLLTVLRDELGLTGAKEPCGRGECGGCTVLIDGRPILSCLEIVDEANGCIVTIEGLAETFTDLREAFADHGAFQCGYCTSGQIVRAAALLDEEWPTKAESIEQFVRHAISGNICRCTGYCGIVDAIIHVAEARGKIRRGRS
jgi:aerobic-type carbon monoxide dehydrogenase small subunit (CoxS/CutS family)